MINFQNMIKKDNRAHIYMGCYLDPFFGSGISVSYFQAENLILAKRKYFESCTINMLDLVGLNEGLRTVKNGIPFTIHTCNRYIKTVVTSADRWRSLGTLEEKAHPELIQEVLGHLDNLGEGRIILSGRSWERDDVMQHLLKYTKHSYYLAQMEMIKTQSPSLGKDFSDSELMDINKLAGSILWRTPLNPSEFSKKMQMAKLKTNPDTRVSDTKVPFMKLVESK